jgi:hypothetical protein
LSGNLHFNYQSTIVNGSNTKFLTEIEPGDLIYLDIDGASNAVAVAEIRSNSQLVLTGKYTGTGGVDSGAVIHVDYHLKDSSPCIEKGDNYFLPASLTTDLDNNARIINSRVDIGAYEYK